MAYKKEFRQLGQKRMLFLGVAVLLALSAIIGAALLNLQHHEHRTASRSESVLPVPVPKTGERFRDIPSQQPQQRNDFLMAGAASHGLNPSREPVTQQAVATACVADATAQITGMARASKAYRNDAEKLRADVQAVNRNCYAKYSEKDYVQPPKPQSHLNSNTFMHHQR